MIQRDPISVKGKGIMQTYWVESSNIDSLKSKYHDTVAVATKMSKTGHENNSIYRLPLFQLKGKSLKTLLEELFFAIRRGSLDIIDGLKNEEGGSPQNDDDVSDDVSDVSDDVNGSNNDNELLSVNV